MMGVGWRIRDVTYRGKPGFMVEVAKTDGDFVWHWEPLRTRSGVPRRFNKLASARSALQDWETYTHEKNIEVET